MFEAVRRPADLGRYDIRTEHVVDSVNEWTVELDADSVEARKRVLREALSTTVRTV